VKTLSYDEQVQARQARIDALRQENTELHQDNTALRRQIAQLKHADKLRRLLTRVLAAAPEVSCDWQRPAPPARYTVTDWQWRPDDGRTPERFEEALDAADRWVHGLPPKEGDD